MKKNSGSTNYFAYRPTWMNAFAARHTSKALSEYPLRARSVFNRDLGTIVHSNFFKRLSHKTQVFSLPFNDHVHTRLTHSIEAAQIGRQIARYFSAQILARLMNDDPTARFRLSIDLEELTSAACLAHDIGHSAFGHVGKDVISKFCKDNGEKHIFDDNKQVVRILLNPHWYEKVAVSGPFVASILKKNVTSESCYRSELDQLTAVTKKLNLVNIRHPASIFMEAADDIAYLSGDMLDFIAIYSGEESLEDFSRYEALSKLNCVDHEGKETPVTLRTKFEKAIEDKSNESVQDFSDQFIRVALNHVFRAIDEFSNHFFSEREATLETLPVIFNRFISEHAHRYKRKSSGKEKRDSNLIYANISGHHTGKHLFALKGHLYAGSIFSEDFIAEQNRLAEVVLNGILGELYGLTKEKKLAKAQLLVDLPDEIRGYLLTEHHERNGLFPAIIDVVSGMTDRYAINFWKEIVGLSALERIGGKPFLKETNRKKAA